MSHVHDERLILLRFPTPLEFMPRLTAELGGPRIYVKREDCTGVAMGGNKIRKLEYLMKDAQRMGVSHVTTHGAVQSNHVRQTAAVAAMLGLKFIGLLEHRLPNPSLEYLESGNAFISRLLGARLLHYPANTDMEMAMRRVASQVEAEGGSCYQIPGGGSNVIGSLGYSQCASEFSKQCDSLNIHCDWVVHATGSGGTQAGLVAGFHALRRHTRVLGVSVRATRQIQEEKVYRMAVGTAQRLGEGRALPPEAVLVNSDFVGPDYGVPTEAMAEAVELVARLEGIILDPVYTGKAMAGLIQLIRDGFFSRDSTIVFIHTGGSSSLFSYRDAFPRVKAIAGAESSRANSG